MGTSNASSFLSSARDEVVDRLRVRRARVGERRANSLHVFLKLFLRQSDEAGAGCVMADHVRCLGTLVLAAEIAAWVEKTEASVKLQCGNSGLKHGHIHSTNQNPLYRMLHIPLTVLIHQ